MRNEKELKGILDFFIQGIKELFNIDSFKIKVDQFIGEEYRSGLDKSEVQFDMNFVEEDEDVSFLSDYVNDNLGFATDQIGNDLRQELQRGMLDGESGSQLKKRVKDLFKDKNYTNRLKTIFRTEGMRAGNYGQLDGAKQAEDAGVKVKKYLDIILDNVTSDICKEEDSKYGSSDQAIPLDDEFVVVAGGKTYSAQAPPFHCNCRTNIVFVREKEDE